MSASQTTSKAKAGRKATAPSVPSATVPAPVAAPAPAPIVAKATASATTHAVANTVVPSTPAIVNAEENVNVVAEFNNLVEKVNVMRASLAAVFSDMKKLEKRIPRELKRAQKGRRRRAAPAVEGEEAKPKKETVFTKPTAISDALCTFLAVPKGTLLSRSDVTTRVCRYAKEHNLMVKQVIKADAPMRKLLALTEADELKILNLQRYLKPHYLKPAPTATA